MPTAVKRSPRPAPNMDLYYAQLREAQRVEQQRLARERDYELYQARRRINEPDFEHRIKRIRDKYAFKLRKLRAIYMSLRMLERTSRDINCG